MTSDPATLDVLVIETENVIAPSGVEGEKTGERGREREEREKAE